jgi:hypothetical protein
MSRRRVGAITCRTLGGRRPNRRDPIHCRRVCTDATIERSAVERDGHAVTGRLLAVAHVPFRRTPPVRGVDPLEVADVLHGPRDGGCGRRRWDGELQGADVGDATGHKSDVPCIEGSCRARSDLHLRARLLIRGFGDNAEHRRNVGRYGLHEAVRPRSELPMSPEITNVCSRPVDLEITSPIDRDLGVVKTAV